MKTRLPTIVIARTAMLGAIACVLMQFDLRLPIFPGFLGLDVSDVPAIIGAITTGPITGLLVVLLKNILDPIIFGTNTGGIGNLANFVIGIALVVPIGVVYHRFKSPKGYLLGSVFGIVIMAIVAVAMNYFVLLPLYSRLFMPMDTILDIANAVNSNVTSVRTLLIFAIVPFNLLKGSLTVLFGYLLYRALKPIFRT